MPLLPPSKAAASSGGLPAGGKKSAGDASPSAVRPAKTAKTGGKDQGKENKGNKGSDDVEMGENDKEKGEENKGNKRKQLSRPMINQGELFTSLLKAILQMQQAQRTM